MTAYSPAGVMASILALLPQEKEFITEDGYMGTLSLQLDTVQVEVSGYGSSTREVSATRSYPNLANQDTANIPKTIQDNINGSNYVKLRDAGRQVGFNVYWDNGVQVDTGAPYTGVAPTRDEQSVPASDISSMRQEIVDRTNQLRQEAGLADLETDVMLTQAAQVRADEMAATGTYSHIRPDGSDRSTVSNCPYTAENIHRIADRRLAELGKGLAEVVVDDWAASSGHLKNILNDGLSEIGVGLARGMNAAGEDCWYCVQIFAYEGYHVTWVDNPVE